MSPSLLGTRGGGSIAAAWAAMVGLGVEGYVRNTEVIMKAVTTLKQGITAIPGLCLVGSPKGSIIAWGSAHSLYPHGAPAHGGSVADLGDIAPINVLCVGDVMEMTTITFKDGSSHTMSKWGIERQQHPTCIHMTLMPAHINKVDVFLCDLKAAIRYVLEHPELKESGSAAMYGMVAKIPSDSIVEDFLLEFESQVYDCDKYE